MINAALAGVDLHSDFESEIDPVTYEVIRHALWNINLEHGNAIIRASGSPIVVYGHDFNSCIMTEDTEYVFSGPFVQFLASSCDLAASWVMEHYGENPGIADGDMFLTNDPWIGATHQMDVTLLCPTFVDGQLFCWVANTLHQTDVGGTTPGSFCPDAPDVFYESTPIPPIKILEAGHLRPDLEAMYVRRSRLPDLLALDLRAAIAGNEVARRRIVELVDKYGATTVKGVMRGIIDHAEGVFVERLRALPDGTWRDRAYLEHALPGDRQVYRVGLSLRKEDDRLIWSNEGTDPQAGSLNCTTAGWRGALINAASVAFCYDLLYAVGGPLRHMEFDARPGTLSSAEHPGAVSAAPAFVIEMVLGLAGNAMGRMMIRDSDQRTNIFTSSAASTSAVDVMSGVDATGRPWATPHMEIVGGGICAFSHRDGVSSGGVIYDLKGRMPDVEEAEQYAPLLYLYRREEPDSGGAGRWRGGNAVVAAHVPHHVDEINHDVTGSSFAVPSGIGLFGGYPGGPSTVVQRIGSDVHDWLARGQLPGDMRDLQGDERLLQPKERYVVQRGTDVNEFRICAGAGYGDPLLREPERVAEDERLRAITRDAAREIFGVVLTEAGAVDAEGTSVLRLEQRRERIGTEPCARQEGEGARIGEYLLLAGERIVCRMCARDLCDKSENYKHAAVRRDLPITAAGPLFGEPKRFVDADVQLRQFACPGCATLLETEVAIAGDEVVHDIELA
jgi:N-methylhydantoinase B